MSEIASLIKAKFIEKHKVGLIEWAPPICVICIIVLSFTAAMLHYRTTTMDEAYSAVYDNLEQVRSESNNNPTAADDTRRSFDFLGEADDQEVEAKRDNVSKSKMLPDMADLYALNSDTIGWLTIDDTVIDYPLMQTPGDENFYLDRDFQKNYSAYGSLILDTDSRMGSGTKELAYVDGTTPSTNLIIHGHHMKNGTMFGSLDKYQKQSYEKEHSIIKLSSLYEKREYEIVSVFLSQVYKTSETDVFKYYKFFQADTPEEFADFYDNIKKMALYDTGVEAEFGDEFITLSVCAYHVENGRLVVVGKRIL